MDFYGTLGPSCCRYSVLYKMFETGMTGIRLNLSHGMLEEHANWIYLAVSAAGSLGIKTKILLDLQGPELRVGTMAGNRQLKSESDVIFGARGIPVPQILLEQGRKGMALLLDDGKLEVEVRECNGRQIIGRVIRGGILKSRKSIAVEGAGIDSPTLTQQDRENLKLARKYGVTGVMLPFVRNRQDIICLKQVLEEEQLKDIKIFAKIENTAGVNALSEFFSEVDEIVIARGDLGNAMSLWKLPAVQKMISKQCRDANIPFMVVTQMLDSMEHRQVPTRAEVSDIYNAVLDGASSLMLTGETAVGEYPEEAMTYLVKAAREAMSEMSI